ncbi:hypothetical protein FFF34_009445 [Inquilinus sp. KBS0705]|nr:hypothetical protein FFF34_009445 [Inquilinus sp. KBS0705]
MLTDSSSYPKKKYFLYIFIAIVFLAAIGWINKDLVMRYYHYSKIHHFGTGDSVYARDKVFKDTSFKAITLYRLLRPLTDKDIDEANLDNGKKMLARQGLNNSSDLKIVSSGAVILLDNLRKNKNRLLGIFKDKVFITDIAHTGEKLTLLLYSTEPVKNILAEKYLIPGDVPPGYIYADKNYYIMYWDTSDK